MSPVARPSLYQRWSGTLILLSFGWLAILLELAPLNEAAGALPSPDILFCVVLFLVMRRPGGTSGVVILLLGLTRDLLGGGPVGLGALTLFAAAEAMRAMSDGLRKRSRIYEIGVMIGLALITTIAHVIILTAVLAALPPLEVLGARLLMTIGAYFVVLVLFRYILRVRAERSGDLRLGRSQI